MGVKMRERSTARSTRFSAARGFRPPSLLECDTGRDERRRYGARTYSKKQEVIEVVMTKEELAEDLRGMEEMRARINTPGRHPFPTEIGEGKGSWWEDRHFQLQCWGPCPKCGNVPLVEWSSPQTGFGYPRSGSVRACEHVWITGFSWSPETWGGDWDDFLDYLACIFAKR